MRRIVTLAIAGVLFASPAGARDIHVNNVGGDDRSTGQQARNLSDGSGPVQTIAKALRMATAGDHIVLIATEQPYRECISLVGARHSGQPGQPFVIVGNGAVLDGSAPVPPSLWKHYGGAVFRFRPPRGGSQQLFLDARPAVRVAASQMSGSPPALEPRQWCSHEQFIYFCVEKTKLPQDYKLTFAHLQTGVTLYQVEYVAIKDLIVQGYRIDGINAQTGVRQLYLSEITCRGNGRSGVTVGGASLADLDLCLLGNNGVAQLLTLPYSETHIHSSDLLGNTAPAWVSEGGRVYLGDQRIEKGREVISPDDKDQSQNGDRRLEIARSRQTSSHQFGASPRLGIGLQDTP